jgi:hypothetical protein
VDSSNPWYGYNLPVTEEQKRAAFTDLSFSIPQQQLNFMNLLRSGALRITEPGAGPKNPGKSIPNAPATDYSFVTYANDEPKDSYTRSWKNKPESYEYAKKSMSGKPFLTNAKYNQMLYSAMKKGLRPKDVFVEPQFPGLLGY